MQQFQQHHASGRGKKKDNGEEFLQRDKGDESEGDAGARDADALHELPEEHHKESIGQLPRQVCPDPLYASIPSASVAWPSHTLSPPQRIRWPFI